MGSCKFVGFEIEICRCRGTLRSQIKIKEICNKAKSSHVVSSRLRHNKICENSIIIAGTGM